MKLAVNAMSLLSPLTGIGQYTRQLMVALIASQKVDATFFYGAGWSKQLRDHPQLGITGVKSFAKNVVPQAYMVSRALMQLSFWRGVSRESFDLYHEPGFIPFKTGNPTVITVHDLSYINFPETHPADRVKFLMNSVPRALDRASVILVDSYFVRDELLRVYGVNPAKVVTAYLGVANNFYPCPESSCVKLLTQYELVYGKYILAVGTVEPRKNLVSAIQAYTLLPNAFRQEYPLVLVGMKGWLSSELEKMMKPLSERGQLRWLGYVKSEELPTIYSGASVFIYPSLYEGFGLPPLEAMACGVPVITSNRASLPEVVGDAGFQLDPYDVEGFRNAMLELIESPRDRNRRVESGIARARLFTWEKCAEQTLSVYRQVVGL